MKVRHGNYSVYEGVEMEMIEDHYEYPREDKQKLFSLCYSSDSNYKLEDFYKHPHADVYCKSFLISEISNAFYVVTKALYKGEVFYLWGYNNERDTTILFTKDFELGKNMGFTPLSDRYIQEVGVHELEKIWEERSHSQYDLPMPEGLERHREIEITK